jgi:hypothetical protein
MKSIRSCSASFAGVSHGIVAKHGGSIRIKSRTGPQHGTGLSIFLPNTPPGAM